jgi:hypothetical protein
MRRALAATAAVLLTGLLTASAAGAHTTRHHSRHGRLAVGALIGAERPAATRSRSTTTSLTATEGACASSSAPGFSGVSGPYCTWTITASVSDRNGNMLAGDLTLVAADALEGAPGYASMAASSSCTLYVTASWIVSPDCPDIGYGEGINQHTAWPLTAEYSGAGGFDPSTSPTVTVTA